MTTTSLPAPEMPRSSGESRGRCWCVEATCFRVPFSGAVTSGSGLPLLLHVAVGGTFLETCFTLTLDCNHGIEEFFLATWPM